MNCIKHYDRDAVYTCVKCGHLLCLDCSVEISGSIYCKECVVELARHSNTNHAHGSTTHEFEHIPGAIPIYERPKKSYNGALLFITSCILPGLGFMYLGLIKRGLFFLASFFITAYLASSWGMSFLGILIPIMWITAFFDGFKKMRILNNGEHVDDDVADIMSFIHKNKNIVIIFLGIFLLNWFIDTGMSFLSWMLPGNFYRAVSKLVYAANKIIPSLLILAGILFLCRNKK